MCAHWWPWCGGVASQWCAAPVADVDVVSSARSSTGVVKFSTTATQSLKPTRWVHRDVQHRCAFLPPVSAPRWLESRPPILISSAPSRGSAKLH
jgi:hypothetical protein